MSELRIKNRSERDLPQLWSNKLQVTVGASEFFRGFICNCFICYFTTAKISFTPIFAMFVDPDRDVEAVSHDGSNKYPPIRAGDSC